MKMKMWMLVFSILIDYCVHAQMISLTATRTPFPGALAGLRYSHSTFSEINLAGGFFIEAASMARLRYRVVGVEALAEFLSARDPSVRFGWKAAIGATTQLESEPWVYKDLTWQQRLNYGMTTELGGMWNMTEAFALSANAQQKFLFNKMLGSTHFLIGLALHWRLEP